MSILNIIILSGVVGLSVGVPMVLPALDPADGVGAGVCRKGLYPAVEMVRLRVLRSRGGGRPMGMERVKGSLDGRG